MEGLSLRAQDCDVEVGLGLQRGVGEGLTHDVRAEQALQSLTQAGELLGVHLPGCSNLGQSVLAREAEPVFLASRPLGAYLLRHPLGGPVEGRAESRRLG